MHTDAVELLTEIGLSRNEAIAYLTLLEDTSAEGTTGYEVATRSGIPRSAVYTVLRKLELAGGAFATGEKPARYLPTSPERFISQVRSRSIGSLERLGTLLERMPKRASPEPVWIVSRYDEVMDRVKTMILGATESIYLSMWGREMEAIRDTLHAVADRQPGRPDLHRVLHCPGPLTEPPPGFHCWIDDLGGDEQKSAWSHKTLLVVDRREALIGGTEPDADNHAVVTANRSLVDVATNHIILDITLLSQRDGVDCADDVGPMMRPHLPTGL